MTNTKRKAKRPAKRTKLLATHHSGKLRPHRHTSYGGLAIILLMAFFPLLFVTHIAAADSSYQTYAVVAGPVPKVAPAITSVRNGAVYASADPITISGTCPANTLVKLFKNEVMGGATLCQSGSFSLQIDLFMGGNSLIARAYNANDIAGPDSVPIAVSLQQPGVRLSGSQSFNASTAPAGQFYVTSNVYYRGAKAGDTMSWPLTVAGGTAPYAVSVGWGDGKTDLVSKTAAGQFTIGHVYAKPAGPSGAYSVVIKATDQYGDQSFLQLVAIVSGNASTGLLGSVGGGHSGLPGLRVAWQMLAVGAVAVTSFWVGEKREVHIITRQTRRLA